MRNRQRHRDGHKGRISPKAVRIQLHRSTAATNDYPRSEADVRCVAEILHQSCVPSLRRSSHCNVEARGSHRVLFDVEVGMLTDFGLFRCETGLEAMVWIPA